MGYGLWAMGYGAMGCADSAIDSMNYDPIHEEIGASPYSERPIANSQ